MTYKIDEIEGIGPAFAEKLAMANIATTDDLLKMCCSSTGREDTATRTGISEILKQEARTHGELDRWIGERLSWVRSCTVCGCEQAPIIIQ